MDRLETCGLDKDDYQLYDAVDVEALEQLLTSANEDIEVQLTVKGVRLALTPDGVNRVFADSTDSADQ
ncbi:HalOD1 output domain-containing protein [Saliphagus infecundisoli]|uniref:HalOD1 output domain-containing protein n=1 Tax=Saliphagus infecundisoli TaxID=1849069 RepID=A0ABD5QKG4_9EURY|nr:HalOD1 output domain-containing protein [Saliphagus infecundisoli]